MSAEEARPARSERRRRKAEGDVRRAHADLLVMLSRFGGEAWQRPLYATARPCTRIHE